MGGGGVIFSKFKKSHRRFFKMDPNPEQHWESSWIRNRIEKNSLIRIGKKLNADPQPCKAPIKNQGESKLILFYICSMGVSRADERHVSWCAGPLGRQLLILLTRAPQLSSTWGNHDTGVHS